MTTEPSAPTSSENRDSIPGERTIPSINRARSLQSRLSSVLAIGLMSALGLGLLTWYYANALKRPALAQQSARAAAQSKAQGEMPLPSLGRIDPPAQPRVEEVLQGEDPSMQDSDSEDVVPEPLAPEWAATDTLPSPSPQAEPPDRRLAGTPFIAAPRTTGQIYSDSTLYIGDSPRPGGSDLHVARNLPARQLLLPRGAFIDCTLETAIDSTLPGMTTCITAIDTFSADGHVVLMERGTKLIGETRGDVQHGQARLFVLWSEARTPTGVVVPLESAGTDELGRSGLPGRVHRHFWERFGAALLISVIEAQDDSTVVVDSSTADLATEALKSTVNIRPTIVKPQGDRIQILVARDVDFRSVYALRAHQ